MLMNARCLLFLSALLLASCDSGTGTQANASPWAAGPQPQGAAPAQASNSEEGAPPAHPAAEPIAQKTDLASCSHMYPGGVAPTIADPEYRAAMEPSYRVLCYRAFALGHSGRTRTALWSAEILDPGRMKMASRIERDSTFESDKRIPENERSELEDYRRSGYDRGHLAPSADMPSRDAQQESFLLSNIVPQNGSMNGGTWRELEMNVRKQAYNGRVFVVTGPVFQGSREALQRRVLVPTSLYKAMYVVNRGAVVFVVSNDKAARTTTLSLDQFTAIYGLDPFPALVGPIRKHNLAMGPMVVARPDDADGGSGDGSETNDSGSQASASAEGCMQYQDPVTETWHPRSYFENLPESRQPIFAKSC